MTPANKKRPVFCTLFNMLNMHLLRDHGLLSLGMSEYYGYDSILVTHENESYPNMKYLPGVKLEFVPKITGGWFTDSCLWLLRNSRRIDVLFQQHIGCRPFMQMLTYKLMNPEGKVYLKFDGRPFPSSGGRLKRPLYEWMVRNSECLTYSPRLKAGDSGIGL